MSIMLLMFILLFCTFPNMDSILLGESQVCHFFFLSFSLSGARPETASCPRSTEVLFSLNSHNPSSKNITIPLGAYLTSIVSREYKNCLVLHASSHLTSGFLSTEAFHRIKQYWISIAFVRVESMGPICTGICIKQQASAANVLPSA